MNSTVYLAHSQSWLHAQLMRGAGVDARTAPLVHSRSEAEIIIFAVPPTADALARDPLRSFRPRDLRRTYVFSQHDEPAAWAPGVYASLPASRAGAGFMGGFYVSHHHREPDGIARDLEAARHMPPDLLWSFIGTAGNHPVRRRVLQLEDDRALSADSQDWNDRIRWGWRTTYRDESRAVFARYAEVMGRSIFIVCPRGRGPGTIRMFEALAMGRCPVIIADEWLPPPFIDWMSCSVRIPESRVHELPSILREREPEAAALGRQARLVWEQFFAPERQLGTLIEACMRIRESAPNRALIAVRAAVEPSTVRRVARRMKGRVAELRSARSR